MPTSRGSNKALALKRQPSHTGTPRKKDYARRNMEARGLYRCRCSRRSCHGRRTFRKHPNTYARGPKRCGLCGALYTVDWFRTLAKENQRTKCECGAVPFPHRRGYCAALGRRYQCEAA